MSVFSADWLALREPADRRARDRALLACLEGVFAGRDRVRVVDLGCGTGSNLRACAPWLPGRQEWRLVDHDPELLQAARRSLAAWADRSEADREGLRIGQGGREMAVAFAQADLSGDAAGVISDGTDLVTAAALFDLASAAWIESLAAAVAACGAAFYTALTYNGIMRVEGPNGAHPADEAMAAAFDAHQRGDKGFGLSAGPEASRVLERAFAAQGYDVRTGDSPWLIEATDAELAREVAKAVAGAAAESGVDPDQVADWLVARLAGATWTIGHTDLIAIPRGR